MNVFNPGNASLGRIALGILIGLSLALALQALFVEAIVPVLLNGFGLPAYIELPEHEGESFGDAIYLASVLGSAAALIVTFFIGYFYLQKLASNSQECPYCLSSIPAEAWRCAYCGADVEARETPETP
jgi:mannose/fructose/N-acetylgalactosamine-specific phosphotransferase system component IIC